AELIERLVLHPQRVDQDRASLRRDRVRGAREATEPIVFDRPGPHTRDDDVDALRNCLRLGHARIIPRAAIVRVCLHGVIDTERRDRVQSGFADPRAPEAWVPLRLRPRPERLLSPLSSLQGVGPAITRRLAGLGLRTCLDALHYAPRRYEAAAPERS